jgi:DNA-binding transcriptional MerR regulator
VTPRLYKAAEVCEAAGLQPYVLRSWEKEFPGIGVQKSADAPRLYRESDLEQVLRIKQLVFGEGLTLAGARRRLEEAIVSRATGPDAEVDEVLDTLGADARSRIAFVRDGLRSILQVLSKSAGSATLPMLPFGPAAAAPSGNGRAESAGDKRSSASRPNPRRAASRPSPSKEKRAAAPKRRATPKRDAPPARKAAGGKRKRVVQRF